VIVIVDYGVGNLGSILNMLRYLKIDATISSKISDIESAEKLILPGVGAFDDGMEKLYNTGLISALQKKVMDQKTPILGICLGMQLFTEKSEEGTTPGLGWIDAETKRFRFNGLNTKLKIPHMGWNTVKIHDASTLYKGMDGEARFYFIHSYYVQCHNPNNIITTTPYGIEFTSSLKSNNIYGVQFHPEKSHKFGMKLFKNFAEMT